MDALRKVTLWVLMLVLFICECMVMGIFAVDAGSAEKSIRKALDESEIVSELVMESLKANSVNGAAIYGETIEELAESDAMTDFFAEYISNGIRESVYGYQVEEIAYGKLLEAVDKGIDQVNAGGEVQISSDEKLLFMSAVSKAAPEMTEGIGKVISSFETTAGGDAEEVSSAVEGKSAIASMMNPVTRIMLIAVAVIVILITTMLSREDGRVVLRTAGPTIAAVVLYGALALRGIGASSSAADIFLNELVKNGAFAVAAAGAGAALIIAAAGTFYKRRAGRRENA
ncbi:MAG: hypothetical protein MR492_04400 [Clostridiales bacterium]|nr:hypothetical protein [Clostridiales bacterium]